MFHLNKGIHIRDMLSCLGIEMFSCTSNGNLKINVNGVTEVFSKQEIQEVFYSKFSVVKNKKHKGLVKAVPKGGRK